MKNYHNFYKNNWNYNTINEFNISGVDFAISKNEKIKLTGKLDKLELQPNRREASVVDYKTSQPKTKNWILGNTKDSKGNYFRQLVFYKLLLDSIPHNKYIMTAGTIDFTEPDEKNRFKKETFEISNDDVKALKETITQTANEILNFKFWGKKCGEKDCEYCSLRELLGKNNVI